MRPRLESLVRIALIASLVGSYSRGHPVLVSLAFAVVIAAGWALAVNHIRAAQQPRSLCRVKGLPDDGVVVIFEPR